MRCFFPEDSVCFNLGSINTQVIIKIKAMDETVEDEHRLQNSNVGGTRRKKSPWRVAGSKQTEGDDSTKISKGASLHSNPRATWAAWAPGEGEGERKQCERSSPVQMWNCVNSVPRAWWKARTRRGPQKMWRSCVFPLAGLPISGVI